jgi:predicted dehydrogenase
MHAFKNWRWYPKLGGGPLIDYGSHQIDIYNWFLGTTPKAVTARGGTYFYDPETHQWFDTVMAVLDYETRQGPLSAFYQVVTSNGYGGRYEVFLGEHGSLEISESAARTGVYRDPKTSDWDRWVRLGFLTKPGEPAEGEADSPTAAKETQPPALYQVPVQMTDPYHTPHLTNFFDAIQGDADLTCPPATAFTALATTLAIADSIRAGKTVTLTPQDLILS